MKTTAQALALLSAQEGSCSVREDDEFAGAFRVLAKRGEVEIRPSGSAGFIDVYAKDFKSRFGGKGEE